MQLRPREVIWKENEERSVMQRWSHSKNRKQPKKTRRIGEMRKVRGYLEPRAACGEWWVEKVMEKLECLSKDL